MIVMWLISGYTDSVRRFRGTWVDTATVSKFGGSAPVSLLMEF